MSKNINIYDLLTTGDHKTIKEQLPNELYEISNYCSETIGEGYFGKVTIPTVGPFISVKIDDEHHVVPIVIKEAKELGKYFIDEVEGNLIINSDNGVTCEAIILYMISKLWYRGVNLHLPFMIGMGSCNKAQPNAITHIILERHGIQTPIEMKYDNFVPTPN